MAVEFPDVIAAGLDFVDVGCSGSLGAQWSRLGPLLNYTGFEPNAAEIQRLAQQPRPYRSCRYLPYAVGGRTGPATLYCTTSPYCWSLLRPRAAWLARFSFAHLFRETAQTTVQLTTLDDLNAEHALRSDILKLDTQGLELPILGAGERVLADVLCAETETGFVENYYDESLAASVDVFMRERGFLLFDLAIHRQPRANSLGKFSRQQPLWCEALWLRDFCAGPPSVRPTRSAMTKALTIAWALGFPDYGLELARAGRQWGLLTSTELAQLELPVTWRLPEEAPRRPALTTLFRMLPWRWRRICARAAEAAAHEEHLLRKFVARGAPRRAFPSVANS